MTRTLRHYEERHRLGHHPVQGHSGSAAGRLPIDLNPYSKAKLEKYKDLETVGDHALPVISNQKMNDYLKDMGELCGRKTFICTSTSPKKPRPTPWTRWIKRSESKFRQFYPKRCLNLENFTHQSA